MEDLTEAETQGAPLEPDAVEAAPTRGDVEREFFELSALEEAVKARAKALGAEVHAFMEGDGCVKRKVEINGVHVGYIVAKCEAKARAEDRGLFEAWAADNGFVREFRDVDWGHLPEDVLREAEDYVRSFWPEYAPVERLAVMPDGLVPGPGGAALLDGEVVPGLKFETVVGNPSARDVKATRKCDPGLVAMAAGGAVRDVLALAKGPEEAR